MKPIAIDPYGCGCTECLTGEYVPLEYATDEQIIDMLAGLLANHTGFEFYEFGVKRVYKVTRPPNPDGFGTAPF